MTKQNRGYIQGVDQLIEETSLEAVLTHFEHPLPTVPGHEFRMPCVFSEGCTGSTYGTLTINRNDPAKVIYCHACGIRGNLLTLLFGLQHRRPPTGGKLRGNEFRESVETLQKIQRLFESPTPKEMSSPAPASPQPSANASSAPDPVNIPLKDQEKTAGLVNLWEEFVTDPAEMPPEAAAYFRKRPWLTPEVCRQWKMGYLPRDGRSLFRGQIVYAHQNVAGDILTYSGRDPQFDRKWEAWIRDGKPESQKPQPHRFVKGYFRGQEVFGQSTERLRDRRLKESLGASGLVVVEGMNDVMRLDALGVTAVGLCSNKATDAQIEKLVQFARQAALGRVVLMPDNDDEGIAGFKELLWELSERGLDVRLAWSRKSHGGRFDGKQPEDLTEDEWRMILEPGLKRSLSPLSPSSL